MRYALFAFGLIIILTACGTPGPGHSGSGSSTGPGASTMPLPTNTMPDPEEGTATVGVGGGSGVAGTAVVGTAVVGVIEPDPPDQTPPIVREPSATPIPTLSAGLGPTELKYRLLEAFPTLFFCDPDYYPVARADEHELARARFADLRANQEEFQSMLAHTQLVGVSDFSDDQKLLIYREHKRLAAIQFALVGEGYRFQLQIAEQEGEGELISGSIDGQGTIALQERTASFASCPICLAADTLIDTPDGPLLVSRLRPGMLVWTQDRQGRRVIAPLLEVGKTVVPASHQVVQLQLSDGRELWASPGHPTADGRALRDLRTGDQFDGATITLAEQQRYTQSATYDLLPAGGTGFYWANGVLLGSTLMQGDHYKPGLESFMASGRYKPGH